MRFRDCGHDRSAEDCGHAGPDACRHRRRVIRQQMRGVANFPRCRNPARLGHELDAGGDIDGHRRRSSRFSSTMTSPRCSPIRNIRRCSSSSASLKRAIRSWMSIAAATAATAELNSASTELATMFTMRPPAASTAGRHTSRAPT